MSIVRIIIEYLNKELKPDNDFKFKLVMEEINLHAVCRKIFKDDQLIRNAMRYDFFDKDMAWQKFIQKIEKKEIRK